MDEITVFCFDFLLSMCYAYNNLVIDLKRKQMRERICAY